MLRRCPIAAPICILALAACGPTDRNASIYTGATDSSPKHEREHGGRIR